MLSRDSLEIAPLGSALRVLGSSFCLCGAIAWWSGAVCHGVSAGLELLLRSAATALIWAAAVEAVVVVGVDDVALACVQSRRS